MIKTHLTVEGVREVVEYNPITGCLFWKHRPPQHFEGKRNGSCQSWNTLNAGRPALENQTKKKGPKTGKILGKNSQAHTVAWVAYYGEIPKRRVCHANGDMGDNRIENLRLVPEKSVKSNKGIVRDCSLARELFKYCPGTGKVFYRNQYKDVIIKKGLSARYFDMGGREAFCGESGGGYLSGKFLGKCHMAHKVAWMIFYGEEPKGYIDHLNGNKQDNRITNLRDVTCTENNRNKSFQCNNTSGVMGVRYREDRKRWEVSLSRKYVGSFKNLDEAKIARKTKEIRKGFHINHGKQGSY